VAAIVSVAGLPVERFVFEGFLPSRASARQSRIAAIAREPRAIVLLEAPTRLAACLADLEAGLGDRDAVVGREVTKLHEEWLRGRLGTIRAEVEGRARVRGECVVLVAGAAEATVEVGGDDLDARIRSLRTQGLGAREIAARLARDTGRTRREVYQRVVTLGRDG
jgi:16S rRNA (cytidine1402-2'-O)-methyltransferase